MQKYHDRNTWALVPKMYTMDKPIIARIALIIWIVKINQFIYKDNVMQETTSVITSIFIYNYRFSISTAVFTPLQIRPWTQVVPR